MSTITEGRPKGEAIDPLAEETDEPILVAGVTGRFEREALIEALAEASEDHEADLQAFAPEAVYGREHLEAAARRALRSHREDRAIARDLAVEVACYAAGTDQIDDALAAVGVPSQGEAAIVCAIGEEATAALEQAADRLGLARDDQVVDHPEEALDRIGVSPHMREQVPEEEWGQLALEHVALLDARR